MQRINLSLFLVVLLLFFPLYSFNTVAQNFEGEIVFSKETLKDTSFYAYKIKGSKIRIEELDKKLNITNYMLVDVSNSSVYAINPKRKLYVEMPTYSKLNFKDTTEFIIYKTENYKRIRGYKCYQWRVRNKKQDTEVAYWVCDEFFDSFAMFLKLLNKDEKRSIYYLHIPNSDGFFPLLSVERSVLREWREKFEVMNIEKKQLNASLFEIPSNYKMFHKN